MTIETDADTWAAGRQGLVLDGRYQIETLLGSGGMGAVFRGQQLKLRKPVAIKLLRPEYARRQIYRERFLREARAASRIGHRNVVDISDFGETDDGEVFFVMELLPGEDLSQRLRRQGALPWREARPILRQIIRGLEAAHDSDVVHRDVKPANVFLVATEDDDPVDVKLLDFGVAKVTDPTSSDAAGLTSADKIMGTAMFMAPEQALGREADARSDVYAVGCIAYQMLAGRPAYPGINAIEILMRRLNEPPPSLRDELPHVPPSIEAFVRQAMARDPVARFQSMREMAQALRALPVDIDGEPAPTAVATPPAVVDEATSTSARRAVTVRPSSIPTEIAVRAPDDVGPTGPSPQPSTQVRRRMTEPMHRPELAAPASAPVLRPSEATVEDAPPASSARAGWIAAAVVGLLAIGGSGVWMSRPDEGVESAAAVMAPPPALAPESPDGPGAPLERGAPGPDAAALDDPAPDGLGGTALAPTTTDGPATNDAAEPGATSGAANAPDDPDPEDETDPPDPRPTGSTPSRAKPGRTKPGRTKPSGTKPSGAKPDPAPTEAPAAPTRNVSARKFALAAKVQASCSAPGGTQVKLTFNVEPSGRTGAILARGEADTSVKDCARDVVAAFDFGAGSTTDAVSLKVMW